MSYKCPKSDNLPDATEGTSVQLFDMSNTLQSIHHNDVNENTNNNNEGKNNNNKSNTNNSINNDTNEVIEDRLKYGALVLRPIEDSIIVSGRRIKRKVRRLVVDHHKNLPSNTMKKYFKDTKEILANFQLAPPTRILMRLKYNNSCDRLLSGNSKHDIYSNKLIDLYKQNLLTEHDDNDGDDGDSVMKNQFESMMSSSLQRSEVMRDGDDTGVNAEIGNHREIEVIKDGGLGSNVGADDSADESGACEAGDVPRLASYPGSPTLHNKSPPPFLTHFEADEPSHRSIEVMRRDQSAIGSPIMDISRSVGNLSKSVSKEYRGRPSGIMNNSVSIMATPGRTADSLLGNARDSSRDVLEELGVGRGSPEGRMKGRAEEEDYSASHKRSEEGYEGHKVNNNNKVKNNKVNNNKVNNKGRRSILKELQLASLARQEQQTPAKKSRLQQLRQQLQQQHFIFDHHEQLTLPPIPSSPPHNNNNADDDGGEVIETPPKFPFPSASSTFIALSQSSRTDDDIEFKDKTMDELEEVLRKLTTRDLTIPTNENEDPDWVANRKVTFKNLVSAYSQSYESIKLNRKMVAKCFSILLEMKKQRKVDFDQPTPMADIFITIANN